MLTLGACSSALSSSETDAALRSDGAVDVARTDSSPDVGACGQTIGQYCQSDAGTCPPAAGISTSWSIESQNASALCSGGGVVDIQECDGYGIVILGNVDTSRSFYYDLTTLQLVRIVEDSFPSPNGVCVAGVPIGPISCQSDGPLTSICRTNDAGLY